MTKHIRSTKKQPKKNSLENDPELRGMGDPSRISDCGNMKTVQVNLIKSKMSSTRRRTTVTDSLVAALVIICVLVPVISGLSSTREAENNRGR